MIIRTSFDKVHIIAKGGNYLLVRLLLAGTVALRIGKALISDKKIVRNCHRRRTGFVMEWVVLALPEALPMVRARAE